MPETFPMSGAHFPGKALRRAARAVRPDELGRAAVTALLSAATAAAMVLTAGGVLAAPAGGTVGSPQPELAQFRVGPSGQSGSGAMLADGTIILASVATKGTTINVCLLRPGARSCAATVVLHAHSGDTFDGVPEVLSAGASQVSIAAEDCCSLADGAVVFNSTDGGHIFGPLTIAGSISSIGAGTVAGGQLVVATFTSSSYNVQAFPPNPVSPETAVATPHSGADGDSALSTVNGGVLSVNDDLTNTYVEYAPSGSNFNASSSYHHVATLNNELTVAASGDALLTDPGGSLTGGDRLWFFNGTSLSGPYKVPDSKAGDDGYFAMQKVAGTVHVFFEGRRNGYDLFEETTRNGKAWTPLRRYASAIKSEQLVPVLGSIGSGVVFEAESPSSLLAQPILQPQNVRVRLARTHVRHGQSTKFTGSASPRLKNQLVTLEVLRSKRWYRVKTTHESGTGKFSFTVPGSTHTYRAVVADKPGYYQYGYSNSVTLTA
ncbi:MAG TPA: hypothetical protein VMA72_24935 [Streptosporangiaceae bacterium]|nr:hypothetical protein [Streptosporangiaceae bacterium]